MNTLTEQQSIFVQAMTQTDQPTAWLSERGLNPQAGLNVYRNNIQLGWRHALMTTFPVLTQLLGDDGMALLSKDYLRKIPSQSGDLNDLGQGLAAFLDDYAPLAEYPYVSSVAKLEWQVHLAHYAANHQPLQLPDLMRYGAQEWLAASVCVAPSCFLLKTPFAAARIWQAHQKEGDLSVLQSHEAVHAAQYILVSRPIWKVQVQAIDQACYELLILLAQGLSFEQAFESLAEQEIELDLAAVLPMLLEAGVWSAILIKELS